jgi:hypothetical protein
MHACAIYSIFGFDAEPQYSAPEQSRGPSCGIFDPVTDVADLNQGSDDVLGTNR